MPGVLIFGDINVDLLARLAAPLVAGEDNLFPAIEMQLGGVGANTAIALRNLGAEVRLVGCVGRDWLGDFALEALESCGVGTAAIMPVDAVTGTVVIPIDPGGQRTILGARGANNFAPDIRLEECLHGMHRLHLVGYMFLAGPARSFARNLARAARNEGLALSLDVGPGPSREAREEIMELAPELDVLFIGTGEAEALTQKRGAEALEAIARCGAREVVLKRGEAGCQFLQSGRWWMVPPIPVDAVDTTGSGDAFAAGYLYARLNQWSATDSALLANAMGAAAATVVGAGANMPGREELARILERDSGSSTSARLLSLLRGERSSAKVV